MWVPSGEKSGQPPGYASEVTGIASPPAVCCTQIRGIPPPRLDMYASSFPSRVSVGKTPKEVICLGSGNGWLLGCLHHATTTVAASAMADAATTRTTWDRCARNVDSAAPEAGPGTTGPGA